MHYRRSQAFTSLVPLDSAQSDYSTGFSVQGYIGCRSE